MSTSRRYIIPTVLTVLFIAVLYYVTIPPFNVHSMDFWWFLIECVIIVGVFFGIPRAHEAGTSFFEELRRDGLGSFTRFREHHDQRRAEKGAAADAGDEGTNSSRRKRGKRRSRGEAHRGFLFWIVAIIVVLLVCMFVGSIASSTFFNARAYSNLLDTEDGDFAEDIAEIQMSSVPVVDRDTAVRLGSRTIGEMSDLVSQYAIDETGSSYTQINYNDAPYRVAPLIYADPIKWITNTAKGLPGYVMVNMATQETDLVRLDEGSYMHISTGEHFNRYLYRYVRFQYPTEMFGSAAFEIDDDGNPYWIVPTVKMRIGLFGGEDYDGAILVNACTGETQYYDLGDVPNWCDKVFSADLVYQQLSYYGKFQSGFWNSIIGQSGVLCPTGTTVSSLFTDEDGDTTTSALMAGMYNYLAINDDVYMYTGMTSANSDESLVGFTLVNLRTKETRYYTCAGATESSAMSSAEGQVQQMSYTATAPLLLNIADRPTYFLSLKDDAGLVKMYAFIDVQRYQIVGTGSSVNEAQNNYIAALTSDDEVDVNASDISDAEVEDAPIVEGTIDAIQDVVVDGNTIYYIKLEDDDAIYTASVSVSEQLPFMKSGTKVTITYSENESVREVSAIE